MSDLDLVSPDLPLEQQNAKLRRIVSSLIQRVERDTDVSGNAFTLFQRAIALEAEVGARTRDLQRTLARLNEANCQLEAATLAAEEANRAKTRFLAAASHDLLQPLNAAKLFIASLRTGALDPGSEAILERLASAFGSLEAILGALLDISRLDSEATTARIGPLPVSRIFEPIGNEFLPLAAQQGVRLRIIPSGVWVESDPVYLRQIVQNLVSNAVRYCGGGRVLVGARRIGTDQARIEVHDTGPGIRAEEIPLIFREFHRLDTGAVPGDFQAGVGLGLAIVERACRLLRHPLEIRSTPGVGTCFTITLPLSSMDPAVLGERGGGDSDETMIALVVTGDTALSETVTGLLESWGMGALSAATRAEAFERIEQLGLEPDAVLVDERLADGTAGTEVIDSLRRATSPDGRYILLVDRATRPVHPARLDPSLTLLGKPIYPHRLRAVLGQPDYPGLGWPS